MLNMVYFYTSVIPSARAYIYTYWAMDPIGEIGFYYNWMYNCEIERVGIQLDFNNHVIDGNDNMIYVYGVYL